MFSVKSGHFGKVIHVYGCDYCAAEEEADGGQNVVLPPGWMQDNGFGTGQQQQTIIVCSRNCRDAAREERSIFTIRRHAALREVELAKNTKAEADANRVAVAAGAPVNTGEAPEVFDVLKETWLDRVYAAAEVYEQASTELEEAEAHLDIVKRDEQANAAAYAADEEAEAKRLAAKTEAIEKKGIERRLGPRALAAVE